mmetsp:Transcript_110956/g.192357  ORF Transcript_110956/g.192357 Transcript_110956/m.192357 type:complete len:228 (-) Transcript_110956:313-996(-)
MGPLPSDWVPVTSAVQVLVCCYVLKVRIWLLVQLLVLDTHGDTHVSLPSVVLDGRGFNKSPPPPAPGPLSSLCLEVVFFGTSFLSCYTPPSLGGALSLLFRLFFWVYVCSKAKDACMKGQPYPAHDSLPILHHITPIPGVQKHLSWPIVCRGACVWIATPERSNIFWRGVFQTHAPHVSKKGLLGLWCAYVCVYGAPLLNLPSIVWHTVVQIEAGRGILGHFCQAQI